MRHREGDGAPNLEEMSTPSTERLTLLHVAASNGMAAMIKALADEDEDLDAKDCCRAAAVQPKAERSRASTSRGSEWTTRPGRMALPKTWLKGVLSPLRPRPAPDRRLSPGSPGTALRGCSFSLSFLGELGLPPPPAHHREHEQAVAAPLPLRHVLLDVLLRPAQASLAERRPPRLGPKRKFCRRQDGHRF